MTMPTPEPRTTVFTGVRVRYDSEKPFEDLVRALMADVGDQPVEIDAIGATSADWDAYRDGVQSHVGAHGFMLFALLDHGGWLPKAGIDRKCSA